MPENDPLRILLIDDDDLSRAVLELQLTEYGFVVTEAESGDRALALLRGEEPPGVDVILSDLQMPGLCGSGLAAELRATVPSSVQLIAMSASEPAGGRVEGFDRFLRKPFPAAQFAAALRLPASEATATQNDALDARVASHGAETEVLDESIFVQLSGMLTPAQLGEMFALSFSELQNQLERMRKALAAGDATALHESAHAIKGGFAILGANELRTLAARMETGTGSAADHAASLREIQEAADRLRRMLTSRGVQFSRDTASGQETP